MLRLRQVLISTLLFVFIISSNILFSKAEIPETIVVNETIFIYENFNGAGKTYIHGSNLGDVPLFRLIGSGATLSNLTVDDAHFLGVWSAVDIGGTDNTVEYVTLKNSSRYGLTFGSALRGTYRHIIIEECQHGISGSSGQVSDWNPSIDCLIEDCYIQNMSVCGIKLKNFLRLTIRNNEIDVNSVSGSLKSGIYFAGSDTASKFCVVENNNVYSSTPNRGIGINIHQDVDPDFVFSEGNIVRNNKITDTVIGVRLTGSRFNIYNNEMINVQTEYEIKTLVYGTPTFKPPSDNIVIEYSKGRIYEIAKSGTMYTGTGVSSNTKFVTVWNDINALLDQGDIIYFAGNTDYFAESRITLSKNDITMYGDSGAKIRMALSTTPDIMFRVTGQRPTIKGLIFSGMGADNKPAIGTAFCLVDFYNVDSLNLENCVFEYFHQYLLELRSCTNFSVKNNIFRYGQNGVATQGYVGAVWNTGIIESNTIHDCSQHGIKLRLSDGVIVRNNNIELKYNYWRAFDHKNNPGQDGRGVKGDSDGATGVYYGRNDAPSINCNVYGNTIKDSSGHTDTTLSNAIYSVGLADGSSWGTPDNVATPKSANNFFHDNTITGTCYGLMLGTDVTYQGVVVDSSNVLTGCHIDNRGITFLSSIQVVDSTIVYGLGLSDQTYDLGGITLKHGPNLGDNPIIQLEGTNNILKNVRLDDDNYDGVSGCARISGNGNEIREVTIDNLQRYGIITSDATNFKVRNNIINSCQHGISGSSHSDGDWEPCTNGLVEGNTIKVTGLNPQHGIKLKNWVNVIVRNNNIDVSGSHTGIIFGAGDASNINCTVEGNNIHSSSRSGYGVVANRDNYISPVPSSGNQIINNIFTNITRTILLRDVGYTYSGNTFTDCLYDYLGDYTITISGSIISARNPSESVITTGTDLGTVLRAVNSVLTDGKSIYIHSGGNYFATSTAPITRNYITIIGDDANITPSLRNIITIQGTNIITKVLEKSTDIDSTNITVLPSIIIDGSTKPNTSGLDTKLDLKDTNIGGTYETKSIILSTPAINSGLSETTNIMVQIIPIFGIVMAVGATSGKVNIKVLLGFLVTIVFVVLFSNIMI